MQRKLSILVSLCVVFLIGSAAIGFGQNSAVAKLGTIRSGYVKMPKVNLNSIQLPSSSIQFVLPKGATSTRGLFLNDANSPGKSPHHNTAVNNTISGNLYGLNTVPTFEGAFNSTAPSIDPFQSSDGFTTTAPFIMIGNSPQVGGTTVIPANVTSISLQLLNPDGSTFANVSSSPFEQLMLNSPNFQGASYSVGGTQFGDAVQRAEFFNNMKANWHTLIAPTITNRATITVPSTVQLQFFDGTVLTVPGYIPSTAPDGTPVTFMLDLLFSNLDFNQIVNDINGGSFTTNAMNYHLYPNTFLFSVIDEQGDLVCCVGGFHQYVFDPSTNPQNRWIYLFTPWMSPGIFGGGAADVTALSHETSEALNDPFGNNIVPTWQFPGIPGDCQANLETGDPVEVLPVSTVPLPIKTMGQTFVYHPQTEALLQWFQIGEPSNAIGGAFSYPNTNALTSTATPCPF